MNRLYRSSAGEVLSEQEWRAWVDAAWEDITTNVNSRLGAIKPVDAFERIKKILKLTEIQD